MRNGTITLAKKLGWLSLLKFQNKQLGSNLLNQVEKAIEQSKQHAENSKVIADLERTKAENVQKKVNKKVELLQKKMDNKLAAGKAKETKFIASAKQVEESGAKSAKFAENLGKLLV